MRSSYHYDECPICGGPKKIGARRCVDCFNSEPGWCLCAAPLEPTGIDECRRCRRPVRALIDARYELGGGVFESLVARVRSALAPTGS